MGRFERELRLADLRDGLGYETGTTDIDITAADYTAYVLALTIVPATGESLRDLVIDLDFDKATTGVNEVATAADVLDCKMDIMIDGTNYIGVEAMSQITLTGTAGSIADGVGGHRFKVGALDSTSAVKIFVKIDTEREDAEIPYRITYRSKTAPTITPVVEG